MTATTGSNKQVRFSNRSIVTVVDRLSLCQEQRSKLWYSTEETDLFKVWLSLRVREVHSQLGVDHGALLDEELVTINAAAILGLEKYLSPEITKEYKIRRLALQKAVLEEHRIHRSLDVPYVSRLAKISALHSQWARQRARAAALFLEQDVIQDLKEMNLKAAQQAMAPHRCCSVPRHNDSEADAIATTEDHKERPYQRGVWSSAWNSVRTNVQLVHRVLQNMAVTDDTV